MHTHTLPRDLNELFSQRPLLRNLLQYRVPPRRQIPTPYSTRGILPCGPQQLGLEQVHPNPNVLKIARAPRGPPWTCPQASSGDRTAPRARRRRACTFGLICPRTQVLKRRSTWHARARSSCPCGCTLSARRTPRRDTCGRLFSVGVFLVRRRRTARGVDAVLVAVAASGGVE